MQVVIPKVNQKEIHKLYEVEILMVNPKVLFFKENQMIQLILFVFFQF